jgi:hypothetical protein
MKYAIYYASSCNLFANLDGRQSEAVGIERANNEFFRRIAYLATQPGSLGQLRALFRYDNDDTRNVELDQCIEVFCSILPEWDMHQFEIRRLIDTSVKEYLVIEDHLFKVIRSANPESKDARYVHVQSQQLADTYREWLIDLFHYGHYREFIEDPKVTTDMFRARISAIKARLKTRIYSRFIQAEESP